MATTKTTLNGAYLLADDAKLAEFQAALDAFVNMDSQHLQLKSNDSKIKSALPSFNLSVDESKKLNISNAISNYSKFDDKILKNISDSSSAIDPDNVSSLLENTITQYVLEPKTEKGKTVQTPILQTANFSDSNILLIGTPEVPSVSAVKEDVTTSTDAALAIPIIPATTAKWSAKIKGSDAYDPNATTLQTINLVSNDSSTLLIKIQNTDAANTSSSYDFTSPNGVIKLSTNATTSNTAPVVVVKPNAKTVKVNPNIKLAYDDRANSIIYTNAGEAGTKDDIRADLTQISNAVFTTKNNVFGAKINYQESLSYYEGEKYKVEISTQKEVFSDSPALSFSPTKNSVVINKYAYLSNDFSISLTGKISGSWGTQGNTEIMSLKNVQVETVDYSLSSANLTYKNVYTNLEYIEKSGLTNLDTYNLAPVGEMQDNLINRDLPKILSGNNDITLKGSGSVDAGAGSDIIVGSALDNTLMGGAGSDKLTGGKGADVFSFQTSDFLSFNSKGDLVFNKSVDTIIDFNPKEGDTLNFGDMGSVAFFQSLSSAKSEGVSIFYIKGKIYYDVNPADDIYKPTVIVKLTGNPKVTEDFTDWEIA
ncbi:MAG: calcium-binding protein [Methylococcaceae bacterium]